MRHITIGFFCGLVFLALSNATRSDLSSLSYERLRVQNTFKRPEDVVRYYVARDGAGFIWSGFMDTERRAFTFWEDAPQRDAFFVARSYEIQNSKKLPPFKGMEHAEVKVRYNLVGIADAHGTLAQSPPEMTVIFYLLRSQGHWKIAKPSPDELAPVVMDKKFALTR